MGINNFIKEGLWFTLNGASTRDATNAKCSCGNIGAITANMLYNLAFIVTNTSNIMRNVWWECNYSSSDLAKSATITISNISNLYLTN